LVLTVLLRYRLVITFGRRGGALLLGLTSGALLIGGAAVAAPAGVLPVSWELALGAAPLADASPADPALTDARLADLADPALATSVAERAPAPAEPAPDGSTPGRARATVALGDIPALPLPAPTADAVPAADPAPRPTTGATTPPVEKPAPDPQPLQAPDPTPAQDGPAAAVVDLTNDARERAGCAPLRSDPRITAAALAHSEDMARNDYFAHDSQDGRGFDDRLRAAGYPAPGAENIAQGQRTAAAVVQAWLDSPGHRRNIEDCSLTTIGVGLAGSDFYWTQDFGR